MRPYGERAWGYARQLAFPRLVGREGERRAAAFLIDTFKDLGYDVTVQSFPIVRTPWAWLRVGLMLSLILLLAAGVVSVHAPFLAAGCCAAVFALMILLELLWRRLALRGDSPDGTILCSRNIIARRPQAARSSSALTIYLMAHHDSKGQSISLTWRIILIITLIAGCFVYGSLHLAQALYPSMMLWPGANILTLIGTTIWVFSLLAGLILLVARTDNRSPGGLDNAGSVGVLLALADTLRDRPLHHTEVVFLSTGAEELGLLGAYAFLRARGSRINPSRSWFLNLDMLGVPEALCILEGTRLFGRPHSPYARWLTRLAARQGTPLRTMPTLPGALLDHIPFSHAGFHATSLICAARQTRDVHTGKDTIDRVNPAGLEEAAGLVMEAIEEIDRIDDCRIDG